MEFLLLGRLEAWRDGRLVELRSKERTLLAVLLLHANETVSSERLIDELWGERPPGSAPKVLATYVWQLRKAIGPIIETRTPGYVISVSPDRLDTSRFDALLARAQTEPAAEAAVTLREALELWRGPALVDVTFGSVARDDVTRLDDLRLSALAQRIDHDLALGRHEEVLAELQGLVAAHPFRERYRVQLMLALYRAGRQADALETYRDARRRFVDELGIEPGPELQGLEHAILEHDPGLGAPTAVRGQESDAAAVEDLAPGNRATGTGARAVRLFERERELLVLDRAVERAASGGEGLLLIEGQAGIGKSRLVAEARRRAAEGGLLALSARGGELERDFPFGVVRQLFEPRLADEAVRGRVLSGAAGAAAPVFGVQGLQVEAASSGEWTFAALHGLYWLTVNLSAEAPLLLAVDDLHWCDRTSLRFLTYLTRRLEGLPVLVVGSLRPAEPGADEALLAELTSDPAALVLTPGLLGAAAAAEVVRERLGVGVAPAFAEACHASTQGNPLLLNELLKALEAERVPPDELHVDVVAELGPRAASRAVLLRLARLPADAVRVARSVAVLGDGAELAAVGALAGLDDDAVATAGRELVRAEILRPEAPLGFVHPLVQAAVYRDLTQSELELSHERAARLLLGLDAPVERVAAHVRKMPRSGEDWVVDVLRTAASAAFAKGAPDAAIASLRRALDEPLPAESRTEVLFELGRAQALTSLPDSVEALRDAYESAGDPVIRGHAADWLACTLTFLDAPDEAAEIARRTTQELPSELDDLARQLEAGELITLFFGARDHDGERLERLRRHRAIDTSLGPGAKMLAAVAAMEWAESAGPGGDVVALARAALRDDTLIAADSGYLVVAAILPVALADLDEATEMWDAVRAVAHRSGFVFTLLAVQLWGGYTQYLRGELAEAETELRAALATAAHWGVPRQRPWATAVLAELLVDRGAVAEARSLLDGALHPHPGSDPAMLLDRAQMRVLLAEGRAEEALAVADVFRSRAGWRRHPRYAPWRSLKAQALDRLGRHTEAVALAAEELEIARGWGSPGTVGRSLRVLGTVDRDGGIGHLEEACALLEHAPARLERAKALAALGGALRRAGRATEARDPLSKALEVAEVCGARALVERTRAEIHATGARPRATVLRGIRSLTANERRIADLAADGLSDGAIAQTLYVTPRTVEVHLGNAYRKLGVDTRRELAGALAGGAA